MVQDDSHDEFCLRVQDQDDPQKKSCTRFFLRVQDQDISQESLGQVWMDHLILGLLGPCWYWLIIFKASVFESWAVFRLGANLQESLET